MFKATSILVLALALGFTGLAQAEDAYYDIPLRDLKLVEGRLPEGPQVNSSWQFYQRQQAMIPYAVLDSDGEAYLTGLGSDGNWFSAAQVVGAMGQLHVLFRAPAGKEVQGRLILPKADATGMEVLRFAVPPSAAKAEAKEPFYRAKLAHYDNLLSRDIPGGAWFRHRSA